MIRVSLYPLSCDVIPQAIFWRPIHYFAAATHEGEDGLDKYQAASFCIGNRINFDLRHYRGHPAFTVSLYLPSPFEEILEVIESVKQIITEMAIPKTAVAWRRGWAFEYGGLSRPPDDRLRESEARILALKIAAVCPGHTATTEYIKRHVPIFTQLSKADLVPSSTRRNEQSWQQIVGNVVSHRDTPEGPFAKGYATRTPNGLAVTKEGLLYLNSIGFSVSSKIPGEPYLAL